MIRNDRQYRITRAQAEQFERSLVNLRGSPQGSVAPAIRDAQLAAIESQLDELRSELAEYDALRSGTERVRELTSLEEFPRALIQARIAAGLTQRELANRLGVKEQQVQRYEATDYSSASLSRINEVVRALGLKLREELFMPTANVSVTALLKRLKGVGVESDFVREKLLTADVAAELTTKPEPEQEASIALRLAGIVNRVFGWTPGMLFGESALIPLAPAVGSARFKLPANAEGQRTAALAVYARYLAGRLIETTPRVEPKGMSLDAKQVREEIIHSQGALTFRTTLAFAWDHGIPVLPLNDSGGFHGATWRLAGRTVIVLKQNSPSSARWLHDLLHELWHAGQDPSAKEFEAVDLEATPREIRDQPEEQKATAFAGDVVLDGQAERLAELCVKEASGHVEWLKKAVPRVAHRERVPADALANYMAFRLSLQGINWWGTASKLQATKEDPWTVARDFLLERIDLGRLGEIDRALMLRALEGR